MWKARADQIPKLTVPTFPRARCVPDVTANQAPGYDGEPAYAQDEYNEYLRWREETEPQTR